MDADYIAGDKGLRQLVEGCIVEIQGLKGAPQHNGVQGKLLKYDREKERWGVRLPDNQVLGVKSINLVYIKADTSIADEEEDGGLGVMKRRFDRIVKKYKLFEGDKADEIADLLCGKVMSPAAFAEKYGMLETEANSFLAWIQQGVEFKEQADKAAENSGLADQAKDVAGGNAKPGFNKA